MQTTNHSIDNDEMILVALPPKSKKIFYITFHTKHTV